MGTPGGRITGIVGAGVAVVTIGSGSADAGSSGTGVIRRAGVTVLAGIGIVLMRTPGGRVTGIIGAGVAVIAIRSGSADAGSSGTDVIRRAGVVVIARGSILLVGSDDFAGLRITTESLAISLWRDWNRRRSPTLVIDTGRDAVTLIAVIRAIGNREAATGNRFPNSRRTGVTLALTLTPREARRR